MARPLRIEFPGAIYHVTSRGNAREAIFLDDDDRRTFLATLAEVVSRFGWLCHAYCLMGNHYHLLVETPAADLSRGMRQLNGIYTQRLNRRAGRVGHLFQGRFKAILVERESHRPPLAELLPREALSERAERDRCMRDACLVYGYTLSEVGRAAGLHYTTVSRAIRQ